MKKPLIILMCCFLSLGGKAQSVLGAWENITTSDNGDHLPW
ncbi:MAG: hypothetical protein ACYCZO_13930 [Daejeonella sp.]